MTKLTQSMAPPEKRYVWYVAGDPDRILFHTKEDAERWARQVYPNTNADKRYSRIYYHEVHRYEDLG